MITVKNILNEYPKLDQAVLPKQLKQDEFDFVTENIDLYGQDETIDQFIDAFISQINKFAPVEKKTTKKDKSKGRSNTIRKATKTKVRPKPTESKETEPDKEAKKSTKIKRLKTVRKVTKAKAKPVKKTKTAKKAKSKSRKIAVRKVVKKPAIKAVKPLKQPKVKTVKAAKPVKDKKSVLNSIPSWLMVVRKFTRMANKDYSQRTLRAFLKDIQGKFAAKLNHAPTPHIDLIRKIQLTIVTSVNEQIKNDKVKLKANSNLVNDCKALSKNYKIKQVKEINNVAVEPLAGMKKSKYKKGDRVVMFNNEPPLTIKAVYHWSDSLPSYDLVSDDGLITRGNISESKIKKKINMSGLSGFGIVSSQDLAKMEFKTLPFTGKFKDLIGNPTIPFHIMTYGLPGSGKSSLAIQFAKYLAENHNLKILYLAKEEGISGTSKEKFTRLNAIHKNIHLSEKMPDNLNDYDVLMIDSVNEMNMTPDHIRQIISKYPKLSTVQLFKATKEGKFLGQSDFAHMCQAEIRCLENTAQAQKNRFGGNMEVQILD